MIPGLNDSIKDEFFPPILKAEILGYTQGSDVIPTHALKLIIGTRRELPRKDEML